MKLNVLYTLDPTGMSKDLKTEIDVIPGHILYDYHSEGLLKKNNLETIVKNHLELGSSDYLTIWKIYVS